MRSIKKDLSKLVWTWAAALIAAIFLQNDVYGATVPEPIFDAPQNFTDVKLITNNDDAFKVKLKLIDEAQSSIDMIYFIWEDDNTSSLLMQHLLLRADQGIKIRILVDYMQTEAQVPALLTLVNHISNGIHNIEVKRFRPPSTELVKRLNRDGINANEFLYGIMVLNKDKVLDSLSKSKLAGTIKGFISQKNRDFVDIVSFVLGLFIRQAPILANEFNNFTKRSHYKLLLVDNKKFVMGGRNISDQYHTQENSLLLREPRQRYSFQDTEIVATEGANDSFQIEAFKKLWDFKDSKDVTDASFYYDENGQTLPAPLPETTLFERGWKAHLLGFDDGHLTPSTVNIPGALKGQIIENRASWVSLSPPVIAQSMVQRIIPRWQSRFYNHHILNREIAYEYVKLIESAKTRIDIVTAYFYIDGGFIDQDFTAILEALKERASEGIHVNIYTNSPISTDLDIVNKMAYRNYIQLEDEFHIHLHELAPGTPPFFDQGSLHTKVMTIDDNIMAVGSFNLDPRSEMYDTNNIIVLQDDSHILVPKFREARGVDPSPQGLKWMKPDPTLIEKLQLPLPKEKKDDPSIKLSIDQLRNSI